MASSTDHGSLGVSSNLTSTMKTLLKEKWISSCQESEKSLSPGPQRLIVKIFGVGTYGPIRRPRIPLFKGGESVIRLSLGRRLLNFLPVAQRTNALTPVGRVRLSLECSIHDAWYVVRAHWNALERCRACPRSVVFTEAPATEVPTLPPNWRPQSYWSVLYIRTTPGTYRIDLGYVYLHSPVSNVRVGDTISGILGSRPWLSPLIITSRAPLTATYGSCRENRGRGHYSGRTTSRTAVQLAIMQSV